MPSAGRLSLAATTRCAEQYGLATSVRPAIPEGSPELGNSNGPARRQARAAKRPSWNTLGRGPVPRGRLEGGD